MEWNELTRVIVCAAGSPQAGLVGPLLRISGQRHVALAIVARMLNTRVFQMFCFMILGNTIHVCLHTVYVCTIRVLFIFPRNARM